MPNALYNVNSTRFLRKWTNARKLAVEILIGQKGDKALHELTRDLN